MCLITFTCSTSLQSLTFQTIGLADESWVSPCIVATHIQLFWKVSLSSHLKVMVCTWARKASSCDVGKSALNELWFWCGYVFACETFALPFGSRQTFSYLMRVPWLLYLSNGLFDHVSPPTEVQNPSPRRRISMTDFRFRAVALRPVKATSWGEPPSDTGNGEHLGLHLKGCSFVGSMGGRLYFRQERQEDNPRCLQSHNGNTSDPLDTENFILQLPLETYQHSKTLHR